jgi:hypothetical protein
MICIRWNKTSWCKIRMVIPFVMLFVIRLSFSISKDQSKLVGILRKTFHSLNWGIQWLDRMVEWRYRWWSLWLVSICNPRLHHQISTISMLSIGRNMFQSLVYKYRRYSINEEILANPDERGHPFHEKNERIYQSHSIVPMLSILLTIIHDQK